MIQILNNPPPRGADHTVQLNAAPERGMRMNGLADALHNSKSGPTYQIGQLKKAGRVRRRRCSSDVRATYAALTDDDRRPPERATRGFTPLRALSSLPGTGARPERQPPARLYLIRMKCNQGCRKCNDVGVAFTV
ncbi:hypothetical protein [Streptomyces flaveus]|uniref:hypothetical protein n=1 Tax=Streptomyces flaveus TaxID=66370 RepID=UPI00331A3611